MLDFAAIPPDAAADPALRADLLTTWAAVTDAGGAVGFTAPAPVDAIGATLDAALARVATGVDALGVLRTPAGDAVGMGLLVHNSSHLRGHWRTVLRVMVHPAHQGGGHGRRLMEGLHDLARSLGLEQLQLTVRGGTGRESFYQRLGYRVVGVHPRSIRLAPGDDRDEIMLVVELDAV